MNFTAAKFPSMGYKGAIQQTIALNAVVKHIWTSQALAGYKFILMTFLLIDFFQEVSRPFVSQGCLLLLVPDISLSPSDLTAQLVSYITDTIHHVSLSK